MSTDPFDDKAATWDDDPQKVERAGAVARSIASSVALTDNTRLLEYGAGTGLVTEALRQSVGPVTLADTSTGMREVIEAKIRDGRLDDARVWDLDLERQSPPDAEFDLIVTVLVLHHIHDLARVLTSFATLLAPGGHLCIADLMNEDGSFHGADFDGHHGFEREALSSDLTAAGFTDIDFRDCTDLIKHGRSYQVFLASSRR